MELEADTQQNLHFQLHFVERRMKYKTIHVPSTLPLTLLTAACLNV